jgi:hypothetical protein
MASSMKRQGNYIIIDTGYGFKYDANIKRQKPEFWVEHLKEKVWWDEYVDERTFLRLAYD